MSKERLFCSSCGKYHNVDGKPCPSCYEWECKKCGWWSPVGSRCENVRCREPFRFSDSTILQMSHPPGLDRCPRCGRKLRKAARDKRRQMKLKS